MSKTFIPGDEYRTNPLSLEPGGSTIRVIYATGKEVAYDKIKNHWAYAKKMLRDNGEEISSIMLGHTDLAKVIREGGPGKGGSSPIDSTPTPPPTDTEDDDDGLPF